MRFVKFTLKFALRGLKLLIAAAGICLVAIYVPRVYDRAVRDSTTSQVFMIVHQVGNTDMYGSGTGFVVRGKNGKTVILTNRHVCERTTNGIVTLIQDGYQTVGKILLMSADADLCAIAAPKGFTGLHMADEYHSGQRVSAVGHPRGMPDTRTDGEIIGIGTEENREEIKTPEEMEVCKSKNYSKVITLDMKAAAARRGIPLPPGMPEIMYMCVSQIEVVHTTIPVSGGNSGSPMIDQDGFVKGIINAMISADGMYGWGLAVPLPQVTKFLELALKEVK